jgi:uncharacterized protein YdeI (YjbR/CyaY-like superfamily)
MSRRTFARRRAGVHRAEYIEWITAAKRAETKARRMERAIAWLAAGKSRNWKYEERA